MENKAAAHYLAGGFVILNLSQKGLFLSFEKLQIFQKIKTNPPLSVAACVIKQSDRKAKFYLSRVSFKWVEMSFFARKMTFYKMKKLIIATFSLAASVAFPSACKEEGVKLTRADRDAIDTIVQKQIVQISPELDRYCRDSAAILRKYYMDSLLIVRQQEIQQQTVPIQ